METTFIVTVNSMTWVTPCVVRTTDKAQADATYSSFVRNMSRDKYTSVTLSSLEDGFATLLHKTVHR